MKSRGESKTFYIHGLQIADLRCPITQQVFFEPVMISTCGHMVEGEMASKIAACPLCFKKKVVGSVPPIVKTVLDKAHDDEEVAREAYFNLDGLYDVLKKGQLRTARGEKYIKLLRNAKNHLNDKAIGGKCEGLCAAEVLVRFRAGKELLFNDISLQQNLTVDSMRAKYEKWTVAQLIRFPVRSVSNDKEYMVGTKRYSPKISLLKAVMDGDFNSVRKLLESYTDSEKYLIVMQASAAERNGRLWQSVSPLEFAAWAGDVTDEDGGLGMLNLLLQHVTQEDQETAYVQLKAVVQAGTEHGASLAAYYQLLHEYKRYEAEFDALRKEEDQVKSRDKWGYIKKWKATTAFWVKRIGGKQRQLPVVGIQQFCDQQEFSSASCFASAPVRRCSYNRDHDNPEWDVDIMRFSNAFDALNPRELPLEGDAGLSNEFALWRSPKRNCGYIDPEPEGVMYRGRVCAAGSENAAAIKRLCEVKSEALVKQLMLLEGKLGFNHALMLCSMR